MLQFARLYPLSQSDLPAERKQVDFGPLMPPSVRIDNPSRDYTPPSESAPAGLAVCGMYMTFMDGHILNARQ